MTAAGHAEEKRDLERLAGLLRQLTVISDEIAQLIGRPAQLGHLGEYIAARIFHIDLASAATEKGFDGRFTKGPLVGQTVNIKWYPKREGLLDLDVNELAQYHLVLTGPQAGAASSRGATRPWRIEAAYLFDARALHEGLRQRSVKIGVASSVRTALWDAAELYPVARNPLLPLSDVQRRQLALFVGTDA